MKVPSNPHEKALFVHQRKGKCYSCGEEGHYKRNCHKHRFNRPRGRGAYFGRRDHGRRGRDQANKENNEQAFISFLNHQKDERHHSNLQNIFFVDYGASRHITKNAKYLVDVQYAEDTVEVGEGSKIRVEGIGKLTAKTISDAVVKKIEATDVAYAPDMTKIILSVSCIRKKGYTIRFGDDKQNGNNVIVEIIQNRDGPVVSKGIERDFGLYELFLKQATDILSKVLMATPGGDWHLRNCHCENETLKKTANIVIGLEEIDDVKNGQCK